MTKPLAHVYIHTPFCRRKCAYCDFYSVEEARAGPGRRRRYFQALEKEFGLLLAAREFEIARPPPTLYIGGGTPSLVETEHFEWLVRALDTTSASGENPEFSVEVNPESAGAGKLAALRDLGVSRFSLGAQSFNDDLLERLGRIHDAAMARAALGRLSSLAKTRGADVSIDLIFAIPGQTLMRWEDDLDEAIALGPDHVSAYGLTYHEGTRLLEARKTGGVDPASEQLEAEMFEMAHAKLTRAGYVHYEISNYARPGHECRHNVAVWRGEDYLGLGASAHSRVAGRRWSNPPDLDAYCRAIEGARLPRRFDDEPASGKRWRAQRLMLALRTREGADLSQWPEAERQALLKDHGDYIQRLTDEGLAVLENNRFALTPQGWLVYDAIVSRFF